MTKVNYTSFTGRSKEGETTERKRNLSRGLIVLATIGVGVGIYGFAKGYKSGYRRGFVNGELYANTQFYELAKQMANAVKETEGE